jgi:beta-lactam-binding protein with PASTA domain/predicted Ser/Thr protein kinase
MTLPRLVGSRYEVGELIGYGGMAEVHRGRDMRLGRDVAIKILRADLARDPSFLNRFRREAQAAAGLNYPAIVAVYDTGEDPTGPDGAAVPFIVMEFVEGRTLRDILKSEGRLPVRRTMEIVSDVCGALDFSHRNGIIHRDIKPANVMINRAGAVKVMDFGIARALADNGATVTSTAAVIGTAQYLSPEQARGEPVDARSDVYSTGCLMYELLTGQPPFRGDSPVAVAYQHVRESAAPPSTIVPDLPRALDSIVMKALAKNPLNRYQSSAEMRADLQLALAERPVQAESVLTDAEKTQYIARSAAVPPIQRAMGTGAPEDYPDDGNQRRTGLIWAAVVVALLLVIGVAAYAIVRTSGSSAAKRVGVPALVGQTPAAAEEALRTAGFLPGTASNRSDFCGDPPSATAPQTVGRVCTQSIGAGSMQQKGAVVAYTIYVVGEVSVPNVTGITVEAAGTALTAAKLKFAQAPVDSALPQGQVVGQSPAAYASVAVGSTITLQVSSGKTPIPPVIGQTTDAAKQALNNAGWANVTVKTTPTTDKTKDGIVLSQDPASGSYPSSQTITLTVGKYTLPTCGPTTAPPTPTGTPTGTATASATPTPSVTPTAPPTCQ